jgi:hypothetical protein
MSTSSLLLVPHLVAGVPGVDEDRADGELVPREARSVLVAVRFVRGRLGMTSRVRPSAIA